MNTTTQHTTDSIKRKVSFRLGRVVATEGAISAMASSGESAFKFLMRHANGDWGDLCDGDKEENDFSVNNGFRIFSAYHTTKGVKLWVITEADRSATTILLPSEY